MLKLRKIASSPLVLISFVIGIFLLLNAKLEFLYSLEALTYDARLRLRAGITADKPAPNLGAVLYDDVALQQVNEGTLALFYAPATNGESVTSLYPRNWPWPRFIHGQVVRELAAEGATAIGFDIMLPGLGEHRIEEEVALPEGRRVSSDEFLALQMRKAGNVYLAAERQLIPADLFLTNCAGMAAISAQPDFGVLRRIKPYDQARLWHPLIRRLVKPLDLNLSSARFSDGKLIVDSHTDNTRRLILPLNGNGSLRITSDGELNVDDEGPESGPQTEMPFEDRRIWNLGIVLAAKALKLDLKAAEIQPDKIILRSPEGLSRTIPLDSAGHMYINWSMRAGDIVRLNTPVYRGQLAELLTRDKFRSAGEAQTEWSPFKNRVVIVGATATGNSLSDLGATPLESKTHLITKHLNIANSLLTDRLVHKSSRAEDLVLMAILGLTAGVTAIRMRPIAASVVTLLLILLYCTLATSLFLNSLYWIPIVSPISCAFVVTHCCILIERTDPLAVARRFFKQAGFKRVESLSSHILLLNAADGQTRAVATLWRNEADSLTQLSDLLQNLSRKHSGPIKLYLVYHGQGPSSEKIREWRQAFGCEIIPLLSGMVAKALGEQNYQHQLKQLEEPYLIRSDPYAEFKPISDPVWFYGRGELVERLPSALAQGQHLAMFGLRKVGKTSLANQLRQRFVVTPAVFLDCQAFPPRAETYFDAIYRGIHSSLRVQRVRGLPPLRKVATVQDFSESMLALFACWERFGQREPFILFFDEIDTFFPTREIQGREEILTEYVKVFRVIRGLAQTHGCVVSCVIAYRPGINRQNLLTPTVGENPMFKSFEEVYLGFLNERESQALVREIGLWKNIVWDLDAAERVFFYCGGHPLITRYFASHACKRGSLKKIGLERVLETAAEIEKTLRKHEIGNYYKEAIGNLLLPEEQRMLEWISQERDGCGETDVPPECEEALSNLENFGLVANANGRLRLTAELFRLWLTRRYSPASGGIARTADHESV